VLFPFVRGLVVVLSSYEPHVWTENEHPPACPVLVSGLLWPLFSCLGGFSLSALAASFSVFL